MKRTKLYWITFNHLEFQLPREAIEACYHPGQCDTDVEFWQKRLNLDLDRANMIKELSEYGAWSDDELNSLGNDELEQKIIWLAAGNIQDDQDHEFNTEESETETN